MTDLRPEPHEFQGVYFDGQTAKRHPVTVTRIAEGFRVRGESIGELVWAHGDMRRSLRTAPDEPARYERGGESPEVLVITDPQFLPAVRSGLVEHGGPGWHTVSRLILPALAIIAGLVMLYLWAVPRMAVSVAARVPLEWEVGLGQSVVSTLTAGSTVCNEPTRMAALDAMVARLTADGRGGRYRYHVTVVDDSLVNALAAPGGEIVIFTGLIAQAAGPDELAGVLAHEIQHVVQQHGARGILRQIPLQLMVMMVSGGEGIATNATQLAARVGGLRYQRRDESDADREGMRMLQAARVDPEGMINFFRKLAAEGGDAPRYLNYLSTHPNSEARMAALAELAEQHAFTAQPIITDAQWAAVTASCARAP